MKLLCKYRGGSHAYGLTTPTSDVDWRGVFVNTEVKYLVGLEKNEHQNKQDQDSDEVYTEFRNTLKLLRGANTQMVEMLFNSKWEEISPIWTSIQKERQRLVSSEKLFSCLRGYMQGELKLALGERTGKLGGKRFAQLEQHGYSPKNVVQLIRLAWAGTVYFKSAIFPVRIDEFNPKLSDELLLIKTKPEAFDKTRVIDMAATWEKNLSDAFENRLYDTQFDEDFANELCLRVYAPLIVDARKKLPPDSIS